MKKHALLFPIIACMLVGCGGGNPDPKPDPKYYTITWVDEDRTTVLEKDESVLENTMPTYDGTTPTKEEDDEYTYEFDGWEPEVAVATKDQTYVAKYKATEKTDPDVIDLGTKTIAEAIALCETLDYNEAESPVLVDYTRIVTIKAIAIDKVNLQKSKAPYNESSMYKVLFGDSTGYIGVAGSEVYDKIQTSYITDKSAKYELKGYLSMYMGHPEIYVPNRKDVVWNEQLNVSADYASYSKEEVTIEKFYDLAADSTSYNMAGHGYGDIVTVKNVSVFDKPDGSQYIATNGNKYLKLVDRYKNLSVDYTYDVIGLISLQNYCPALIPLSVKSKTKTTEIDISDESITETTIENFSKNNQLPQDDTDKKFPDLIKSFGNIYKSTVYGNFYIKDGKYYVMVGDNYVPSQFTSIESGYSNKYLGCEGDYYWDVRADQVKNCGIYDWICEEGKTNSVDIYFSKFQPTFASSKTQWKIVIYDGLLPESPLSE